MAGSPDVNAPNCDTFGLTTAYVLFSPSSSGVTPVGYDGCGCAASSSPIGITESVPDGVLCCQWP